MYDSVGGRILAVEVVKLIKIAMKIPVTAVP